VTIRVGALALGLISVCGMTGLAQRCDATHYRWPEKTSTALLDTQPEQVSIGEMLRWRHPEIGPGPAFFCAPRVASERHVLSVLGWVRRVDKTKDDGDWHIELTQNRRDDVDACIVAEIPLAELHPAFRTARGTLDSALAYTKVKRKGDLAKPVRLRFIGAAFFDGEHLSRKGRLQPHGRCWSTVGALWEIHPVFRIERPNGDDQNKSPLEK
jgi:hypothetical protein